MNFTAIDFEYALGQDSACSVGIVTVKNGVISEEFHSLIKPPDNKYSYYTTRVHGLTPAHTRNSELFPEVFPEIKKRLENRIVVAHNIATDRSVLHKNMNRYDIPVETLPIKQWECTLKIYRQKGFKSCKLSSLCSLFNIELDHHQALSDAKACAMLYLKYLQETI
jgi:DNA polymerase-3 subunit epsilon